MYHTQEAKKSKIISNLYVQHKVNIIFDFTKLPWRCPSERFSAFFLTLINHNNCSEHLLRIFIKPLPEAIRKGKQRSEQGEKAEKMEFWICVCYYLVCTGPPLPLPYLARDLPHSPAAMVIRTGGTARSPPLCYPHPISSVRDLRGESLWWPLFWRSWVYKLILDNDGDHFLFSPIFNRILVSRDIDCYSLAKISEILAGANILSTPIFVTFSAWRAGITSRYSAGENPPIKAGRPVATAHLATAYGGLTLSERCRSLGDH